MSDQPVRPNLHESASGTAPPEPEGARPLLADNIYRKLVELSPDAIVIHSAGRVVFINQAGADILRLPIDEILNRSIMDFIHPAWQDVVHERIKGMIESGQPGIRTELHFLRPDGAEVIGETTSVPFIHEGQPAVLVSVRDITAQVQYEVERQRLLDERAAARKKREDDQRFLIEIASILNGSLDYGATLANVAQLSVPYLADGCVVDIQQEDGSIAPVAIAHIDPEQTRLILETRRRYPLDPAGRYGTPRVLRHSEALLVPEVPPEMPGMNARNEEHRRYLEAMGLKSMIHVPLRSRGQSLGVITFAMTTSGRAYGEAELAIAEEVAAHAGIAVDNARLYHEAQEALRLRDEFLTVASHELKTPLTALHLQLQLLQRAVRTAPPNDAVSGRISHLSAVAERQMGRLSHLINDVLDVSQIAEGRLQLRRETFDLAILAQDLAERFEEQFRAAGSSIDLQVTAVTGYWDRARVEQALTNLLSNAVKYGGGLPIKVIVESDAGNARIVVRDEGMGIAAENLHRIFERYERAVSTQHYGGMGLGLHIAREMIEAHGGTLTVVSEPGRGSTFTMQLPLLSAT